MRSSSAGSRNRVVRFLKSPYLPLSLIGLLLAGLAIWLVPRRVSEFVTADGDLRWNHREAPPRRTIVWQPAERVPTPNLPEEARESLIRPQPDQEGRVLYFTLRKSGEQAHIYRSRREDGRWLPAEPVEVLNSAADDIGPVLSADGRMLYLYSNREGGEGGFDLYLAERNGGGWSPPVNLGPRVNSSADEYDPAVSPDGRQLFFASNRSAELHEELVAESPESQQDRWQATLRSDQQRVKFNLYAARRESPADDWQPAEPLHVLNRAHSNEGAPYVAPSGRFLYFASDRAARPGERRNYDLYRARIGPESVSAIENLGRGVNSAANEIEPALSDEGFRLYFSRNLTDDPADEQLYALYQSTAVEVFEQGDWDAGNWQALLAFLANNWWWILLAALAAALLASLAWFFRRVSFRRVPVPGAFLIALLLHLLLGVSSFFVYFGDGIFEQVRKQFREIVVASRMSRDNLHQSHEAGRDSYEKVADLQAVETVVPSDVPRQVTETPNIPVATDSAVPQVPARLNQNLQTTRVASSLPRIEPTEQQTPSELQRRLLEPPEQATQPPVELAQTEAVESETEIQPESRDVATEREQAAPSSDAADIPRRTAAIDSALPADATVRRIDRTAPELPQKQLQMTRSEAPVTPVEAESVATEQVQAAESSPAEATAGKAVLAAREAESQPVAEVEPTPSRRPLAAAPAADSGAVRRQNAEAPPKVQLDSLARSSVRMTQSEAPQVAPESVAPATSTASLPTRTAQVDPGRSASQSAADAVERLAPRETATPAPRALAAAATAPVERPLAKPPQTTTDALARLSQQAPQPAAEDRLAPESLRAVQEQGEPQGARSARVELARRETQTSPEELLQPMNSVPTPPGSSNPSATTVAENANRSETKLPQKLEVRLDRLADARAPDAASPRVETGQLSTVLQSENDAPAKSTTVEVGRQSPELLSAASESIAPESVKAELNRARFDPASGQKATAESAPQQQRNVELDRRLAMLSPEALSRPLLEQLGVKQDEKEEDDETAAGTQVAVVRERADAADELPSTPSSDAGGLRSADAAHLAPSTETRQETAAAPRSVSTPVLDRPAALADVQTVSRIEPRLLAAAETGGEQIPAETGEQIDLSRAEAEMLEVAFQTNDALGGPHSRNPRLVLGSLSRENVEAPLSGSKIASRLLRRPARAPLLLYAEDDIGFRQMFRLRQGEAKLDALKAFGGTDETLEAVQRGLKWLATQQHDDGRWSLHRLKNVGGAGNEQADSAATGFALLAFLGDGHTHQQGQYKDAIGRGLQWLVENQTDKGELSPDARGNSQMYAHGIATIALCEAYELSKDPALREPAQKALDFIVWAQHEPSGGWRYHPNQSADTSVVGWQVMALKSGQIAELEVPEKTLELVKKWLRHVEGKGDKRGTFGYTGPQPSPAMTAEALLCLQYLGTDRNDPRLRDGAEYLLQRLPRKGSDNSYYWYYGTQVMYHMQGEYWRRWNSAYRDMLVDTQKKDGSAAGSWDPRDSYEKRAGRIYSTSLRILMLEVFYRHLPLYSLQQD